MSSFGNAVNYISPDAADSVGNNLLHGNGLSASNSDSPLQAALLPGISTLMGSSSGSSSAPASGGLPKAAPSSGNSASQTPNSGTSMLSALAQNGANSPPATASMASTGAINPESLSNAGVTPSALYGNVAGTTGQVQPTPNGALGDINQSSLLQSLIGQGKQSSSTTAA